MPRSDESRHHHHHHKHKHKHKHREREPSPAAAAAEEEKEEEEEGSGRFVWKAKLEKQRREGALRPRPRDDEELRAELAKVKRRRVEREAERELWAAERERMEREANAAELGDWAEKEEAFHLRQAAERAELRVRAGRAGALDRLFLTLHARAPTRETVFVADPASAIAAAAAAAGSSGSLASLRAEAEAFFALDSQEESGASLQAFWKAFLLLCDDALAAQQQQKSRQQQPKALHTEVVGDIAAMLAGKSSQQLEALREQVFAKARGGNAVDAEYWEALLGKVVLQHARMVLLETHREALSAQLAKFGLPAVTPQQPPPQEDEGVASTSAAAPEKCEAVVDASGRISPVPLTQQELDAALASGVEIVDAAADMKELEEQRLAVDRDQQFRQTAPETMLFNTPTAAAVVAAAAPAAGMTEEEMLAQELARGTEEDEDAFNTAVDVLHAAAPASWKDKYRPRKPRFFNRVLTGYDWSKYNQSHYDHDNPPPKIIQGYKFNVFYPDLIDPSKAPRFFLEADPEGNPDFCLLRFHAGPPYEDIAFRIVNREWGRSQKHGFKCTFDRGILHLWFRFKRARYRR